jgi:hypothetical protein
VVEGVAHPAASADHEQVGAGERREVIACRLAEGDAERLLGGGQVVANGARGGQHPVAPRRQRRARVDQLVAPGRGDGLHAGHVPEQAVRVGRDHPDPRVRPVLTEPPDRDLEHRGVAVVEEAVTARLDHHARVAGSRARHR